MQDFIMVCTIIKNNIKVRGIAETCLNFEGGQSKTEQKTQLRHVLFQFPSVLLNFIWV